MASHGGKNAITDPKILDFSSSTSPILPKFVNDSMKDLSLISEYPDPQHTLLRKQLSKQFKISPSNVIIGNGAVEIIYDFCKAFLNHSIDVLIPTPTFSEYESATKLANCKIHFFKTMDLSKNLKLFLKKIPHNGCVFICNPNNPTGKLLGKQQMRIILETARKNSSFVFVDECFMDLATSNQSVIPLLDKYTNLLILKSFTKSFALAGIRIGFALSSKIVTSTLYKVKIPWSVNGLAQKIAIEALKNKSCIIDARKLIQKERIYLTCSISGISGFKCIETSANFILINSRKSSKLVCKKLLSHHILVRDCSTFRGLDDHFIRVSVKTHKNNVKLIEALEVI